WSLVCAGVRLCGFISRSRTPKPRSASWKAASHPARPPPTTVTCTASPRRGARGAALDRRILGGRLRRRGGLRRGLGLLLRLRGRSGRRGLRPLAVVRLAVGRAVGGRPALALFLLQLLLVAAVLR